MNQEIVFVVTESPEGGYEARALGYSIFTYGDTLDELRLMVKDAVNVHFDEDEQPLSVRLQEQE